MNKMPLAHQFVGGTTLGFGTKHGSSAILEPVFVDGIAIYRVKSTGIVQTNTIGCYPGTQIDFASINSVPAGNSRGVGLVA